uniref:Uncharacterized protein n=1 Tax=Plectus sambesii TaxID=2011161 RepID=A0A914VTQ3_9BILA
MVVNLPDSWNECNGDIPAGGIESNVLAAVNSSKWLPVTDFGSTYSFLSGDSLPGGDTCDADGCTRRGPQATLADSIGVERVLLSLDQLAAVIDAPLDPTSATSSSALNDPQLRELLEPAADASRHLGRWKALLQVAPTVPAALMRPDAGRIDRRRRPTGRGAHFAPHRPPTDSEPRRRRSPRAAVPSRLVLDQQRVNLPLRRVAPHGCRRSEQLPFVPSGAMLGEDEQDGVFLDCGQLEGRLATITVELEVSVRASTGLVVSRRPPAMVVDGGVM